MATIKMRKGNVIADINSDPECVANAKANGFVEVEEIKEAVEKAESKAEEVAPKKATPKKSVK